MYQKKINAIKRTARTYLIVPLSLLWLYNTELPLFRVAKLIYRFNLWRPLFKIVLIKFVLLTFIQLSLAACPYR